MINNTNNISITNNMVKSRLSATIEADVLEEWRKYCDTNAINASKKLEKLIKEFLRRKK